MTRLNRRAQGLPASASRNAGALCLFMIFSGSLAGEVRVLKNFTLIDGTGRAAAANSAMIIDNGRIRWVGPVADLKAPAGRRDGRFERKIRHAGHY